MSFDTERFICELETRRALWDMSCDDYSNRDIKGILWKEITEIFASENSTINEKKELCTSLQKKKWKNIRDSFLIELRRIKGKKSSSGAARKSPYIYFNQLLFLKPTVEQNSTESNLNVAEDNVNNPIPESVSQATSRSKKKKVESNIEREDLVTILKESINSRNERESLYENESDRMFLLSLLHDFEKIPESANMSTKIEIINMIQRAHYGRHDLGHVEPRTSYTHPGYSRTSYPSYHQEYHQGYFTQPADSRRPSVSRPVESPPFHSRTDDIESPESNYSQSSHYSEYSEILDTFVNP